MRSPLASEDVARCLVARSFVQVSYAETVVETPVL